MFELNQKPFPLTKQLFDANFVSGKIFVKRVIFLPDFVL